jgi:hypothetical protein
MSTSGSTCPAYLHWVRDHREIAPFHVFQIHDVHVDLFSFGSMTGLENAGIGDRKMAGNV